MLLLCGACTVQVGSGAASMYARCAIARAQCAHCALQTKVLHKIGELSLSATAVCEGTYSSSNATALYTTVVAAAAEHLQCAYPVDCTFYLLVSEENLCIYELKRNKYKVLVETAAAHVRDHF
eukprot:14645-Heterococcus_DN1.PRE.6